uniref:Uncharacterized protein n=1 Tax=Arundo donax TaxID=35708 RepID=A0A0A8ZBG2_ARUDO
MQIIMNSRKNLNSVKKESIQNRRKRIYYMVLLLKRRFDLLSKHCHSIPVT